MPKTTLLWLAADHNGSRTLFESAEGYEVWADRHFLPEELYSAIFCQQPPNMPVPDGEDNQ